MARDQGQQGTGGFTRRMVLRGGLLAGVGVATAGAMSDVLTGTAKAATASTRQLGWAWCDHCATMWWYAGLNDSACASPEAPRNSSGDPIHSSASRTYNYELDNNIGGLNNKSNPQPGWRWCNECQGLFWGGGNGGVCMGNAYFPHVVGSTSYDLYFNLADTNATTYPQAYWRWCNLCSLLYWQGGPSGDTAGWCPTLKPEYNYAHHAGSSTNYCIFW